MRSRTFLTLTLILISISSTYGQDKPIKLNLKEGHRYVFEKLERSFPVTENEIKMYETRKIKVIQCDVEKVIPDSQIIVKIRILQNKQKRDSYEGFDLDLDYFFPEYNRSSDPDLFQQLICRVDLLYALNLKTRKAVLLNKSDLMAKFREILLQKDPDEKFAELIINNINHGRQIEQAGLVSFLLWFHNSRLTPDQKIKNSVLSGRPIVVEKSSGELQFTEAETKQIENGKSLQKFRIDTIAGIPVNYLALWMDPTISATDKLLYGYKRYANEIRINLIASGKIKPEMISLTGKIESPLSKKIFISYLDKPFGIELRKRTDYLDDKNYFTTELPFPHAGFIYIQNDNPNKFKSPGTFVFYAEPGDSICFEATGAQLPWKVEPSGDRIEESNLLLELRDQVKLSDTRRTYPGEANLLLDHELDYWMVPDIRSRKIVGEGRIGELIPLYKKSEEIISRYRGKLKSNSFEFIRNEVKSCFVAGIFNVSINSARWLSFLDLKQNKSIQQKIKEFEKNIETLNIKEFYNDYGLYSRIMAAKFLSYQYNKQNKTNYSYVALFGFRHSYDIEQVIQYARMILTGSPLYRQIGELMNGQFGYIPTTIDRNDSVFYRDLIKRNINLLISRCNDNDFLNEIYRTNTMLSKSQSADFVPDINFLDPKGELNRFQDYFGTKPSIFFIAMRWTGDRYSFDDKAKVNPDLNFIMVMEGDNFREWTEFLKAAEPVADQLFLKNDTISLRDIFIRNHDFYLVFDKKGNLEGYENDLGRAIQTAKNSLIKKKKPDITQLKLIIKILGISLALFLTGMLIWRWRVRQRFRKEQQQRRLRELELTAIRSQMNPHFLFNSLNSVQNLIQQNRSKEAHLYLADFAGLIRKVLRNTEKEEVSLAEELETVRQYLNLEKLRFDFNFEITVEPGIDPQNTMIPSMLLQTFAENAVIHGLQNKPGNRNLKIEASRSEKGIIIVVEDNGIGREAARKFTTEKNGKGYKLMKERLEILQQRQGEKYSLEIIDIRTEGETGTIVEITIPEEK